MTAGSLPQLAARFARIYTGALTDVLAELGRPSQALPAAIEPLGRGMGLVGPAFPVETRPGPSAPDEVTRAWEMLQAVPPGHVLVCATGAGDYAVLGDLAAALLKANGCAGGLVEGGCRDIDLILEIGFPVFCGFVTPKDISHGHGDFVAWGHTVTIGDVTIATGDYVVADADGAVVIPMALIDEVLVRAEMLVRREAVVRMALLRGSSPEEAYQEATSE